MHYRRARQPGTVGPRSHPPVYFRRNNNVIACGELGKQRTQDLFTGAERIHVRRVERGDSGLECLSDEWAALLDSHAPGVRSRGRIPV